MPEESLISGALGSFVQGAKNSFNSLLGQYTSSAFSKKMYDRQRKDSLADYHMQNDYNSPTAQMQRLRKAGLNPNLVYGSGSATTNAASVRPADAPQPEQPKIGGAGNSFQEGIGAYIDMRVKEASIDNLREQNTLLKIEQMFKGRQTAAVDQDIQQKAGMYPYDIAAKSAGIDKTIADTKFTLDQNDRAAAMQAYTIRAAVEAILKSRQDRAKSQAEIDHIKQQIQNLSQDERLKNFDEEMQRNGIPRNSPAWWKAVSDAVSDFSPNSISTPAMEKLIRERPDLWEEIKRYNK